MQVAQHMEAVMKCRTSRSTKPVRAVLQGIGDPRVEVEFRDLKAGQKHLQDVLQQLGRPERENSDGTNAHRERSPEVTTERKMAKRGAGSAGARRTVKRPRASVACAKDISLRTSIRLDRRGSDWQESSRGASGR